MHIRIIASEKSWIEGNAVEQLNATAALPGMLACAGMPDLHAGKDAPIGAVFACQSLIYPHLVGSDIGCGMGVWQTELRRNKVKIAHWEKRLQGLDDEWKGDVKQFLRDAGVGTTRFDRSLGTIGGGNHFAELQQVKEVYDQKCWQDAGLDREALYVLVHSGSRGLGASILEKYQKRFSNDALVADSDEGRAYIESHNRAVGWARANRALIAERFLKALAAKGQPVLDICHNNVQPGVVEGQACWLHRKGAAPADRGLVVIPGSRGALTYLVAPRGDQSANLETLAHGAGRKWRRGECRGRLEHLYSPESLRRTKIGSWVICADKRLLYEEAPQVYKDIDAVVQDLCDAGLIEKVAAFAPVLTFKVSAGHR